MNNSTLKSPSPKNFDYKSTTYKSSKKSNNFEIDSQSSYWFNDQQRSETKLSPLKKSNLNNYRPIFLPSKEKIMTIIIICYYFHHIKNNQGTAFKPKSKQIINTIKNYDNNDKQFSLPVSIRK